MTTLLVGRSTIKIEKVILVLLLNKILKQKNQASSLDRNLAWQFLKEQAVKDGVTEDCEASNLGRRMQTRSNTFGATSWDIVSKISRNSEIILGLLWW